MLSLNTFLRLWPCSEIDAFFYCIYIAKFKSMELVKFSASDTDNLISHVQVEIKNLNSFSSINRAIDFEISRQVLLHSQGQGDQIVQETRLWEEGAQVIAAS